MKINDFDQRTSDHSQWKSNLRHWKNDLNQWICDLNQWKLIWTSTNVFTAIEEWCQPVKGIANDLDFRKIFRANE